MVLSYFNDSSIDIQALTAKGQFEFLTYDSAYVINGTFCPDAMVKLLKQTVDNATARGFEGMRVIGEMTWILKHLKNFDEVVRYESMVNKVFEENNALGKLVSKTAHRSIRSASPLPFSRHHSRLSIQSSSL